MLMHNCLFSFSFLVKLSSLQVNFVAFNANKNIFNIINYGPLIDDFAL